VSVVAIAAISAVMSSGERSTAANPAEASVAGSPDPEPPVAAAASAPIDTSEAPTSVAASPPPPARETRRARRPTLGASTVSRPAVPAANTAVPTLGRDTPPSGETGEPVNPYKSRLEKL